jgi:hypothetical protein
MWEKTAALIAVLPSIGRYILAYLLLWGMFS